MLTLQSMLCVTLKLARPNRSCPKASESTQWNTRNGLISVRRQVEECNAGAAVAQRQNICLASQRISAQSRGPLLFRCSLHS
ncbi:hypothetical protein TSAR_006591 [Trichomalopsis sarcophagae]|uniref:Uncharacterized protein n=1 Tax=Trichomalopsis sarcophagae TaxID=543379 RepID=A0A232EH71_9HYME|nr:hypothetical protein TSAR_006591 [Trichomalopsis sarcophagae]